MTFATDSERRQFEEWVLAMQKPGESFTKDDIRFFYGLWRRLPRLHS